MKSPDKSDQIRQSSAEAMPRGEQFRLIVPPDDPDAHTRKALPGVYRITFPVCEVHPSAHLLRLVVRFAMTGPLESEAPRTIVNELDITDTLLNVQEEFRLLDVELQDGGGLEQACNALRSRVNFVHTFLYLNERGERTLEKEMITAEEAEARLRGQRLSKPRLLISPSLLPSLKALKKGKKSASAERRKLSRPIIFWATIIRCDAILLQDGLGYQVAWEARIENYDDDPLIHRWKQRVDSLQAYEGLRRDLEVLCVNLESYDDIPRACRAALSQNVIVELPLIELEKAKGALLEHFTGNPHQLPPLSERLTREEAEEYCRQHGLEAFELDLRTTRFLEKPPFQKDAAKANGEDQAGHPCLFATDEPPMQSLFGDTFDSYELVQAPVEPYASNPIAACVGTYWLRASHCSFQQRNRFYHTRIRLEMVNEELTPPFRAIYELDRKLTYSQLCAEFQKLRVFVHSKGGLKDACKSVLGDVGYARCLPDDAPQTSWQAPSLN